MVAAAAAMAAVAADVVMAEEAEARAPMQVLSSLNSFIR